VLKAKLILLAVKIIMWIVALGVGIWYLSSSLSGGSLTYTSTDRFLQNIGVKEGDITGANGCFLCRYVSDLFDVLGKATGQFWTAMLDSLWVIMVIGFGAFLFIHAIQHIYNAAKETSKGDTSEKKLEFKSWFDKVWKQGLRIMFVGVLIGGIGTHKIDSLRIISDVTITPVMYFGAELSMAASGVISAADCYVKPGTTPTRPLTEEEQEAEKTKKILEPVLRPFMCVIGNINSVMLAGASGGFSLMNYAWMGLGGGVMTWVAGLAVVLMFLWIGFNLFFQILSVVFKLIFLIIFMPLLLAAAAFEQTWGPAKGLLGKGVDMLVSSAVRIVAITLKVLVIYTTVSYTADSYFPGPTDNYSAILPPLMGQTPTNPDLPTGIVMNVFKDCESVSLENNEINKDKFKECFINKKNELEQQYPRYDFFGFMKDGWDFLLLMTCLFLLYNYAISPKIDKLLGKDSSEMFDIGAWIKDFGGVLWNIPLKITDKITSAVGKK
jgi:hypothetical protein